MATSRIVVSAQIAGQTITQVTTDSHDGGNTVTAYPLAATSGTLSTRTDNDTGVVTASGHSISTSDVVDVYWTGGMRYGMTATVSGDDITVDGGAGDNLPTVDSAVTIAQQEIVQMDFDGTKLIALVVGSDLRCSLDFQTSGNSSLLHVELAGSGEAYTWSTSHGASTPLNGTLDHVDLSCGSTTAAATISIAAAYASATTTTTSTTTTTTTAAGPTSTTTP